MALTVSLNKSSYNLGEPMELTVQTGPGERGGGTKPVTVHVLVDGVGEGDATGTINLPVTPVGVSDPDRIWSPASDDTATAVFTSVA